MTLISARNSAHDFHDCEVYSKRVCSIVASLTGEMAAQSFTYHAHGTADSNSIPCAMDQQSMLAQARPPDDKSSY